MMTFEVHNKLVPRRHMMTEYVLSGFTPDVFPGLRLASDSAALPPSFCKKKETLLHST